MWEHLLAEGYLERLEAAYQEGEIDEYHLLPGGKLVQGKARPDRAASPYRTAG